MQTYRALGSLAAATLLLAAAQHGLSQHSRTDAVRNGSVAFSLATERPASAHHLALASFTSPRAAGDVLDSVRRQPKDLLNGIELSRAERKAVNGIVRKNGRQLRMLEERRRAPGATPAAQQRVEQDIAILRDRERAELRRVLSPSHRRQFDHNLSLIASSRL